MGENEKCPKCKAKLRFEAAGNGRQNCKDGLGAALPDSYNCIMCGYYREEFPVTSTPKEFKKGGATNDYPDVRKSLGEPGWLKTRVQDNFDYICILRASNKTWASIRLELIKKDEIFKSSLKTSIGGVFRKEMIARGMHD